VVSTRLWDEAGDETTGGGDGEGESADPITGGGEGGEE